MIINANSGGTNLLVPFLLALVPLCLVLLVVRWIDYQDPEPMGVLVAAFLWGGGRGHAGFLDGQQLFHHCGRRNY